MSQVHDLTVEVLREIRDGIGRVEEQQQETNVRLDNLIATMGGCWRSHEARLQGLEKRVDHLERGDDT